VHAASANAQEYLQRGTRAYNSGDQDTSRIETPLPDFPRLDETGNMSEDDYRVPEVKRSTLVTLFLNELATDRYITTHLYGAIRDAELDLS